MTVRKFPGPAGVLPARKQGISITSFLENLNEKDKDEVNLNIFLNSSIFNNFLIGYCFMFTSIIDAVFKKPHG